MSERETVLREVRQRVEEIQTETPYWDDERSPDGVKADVLAIIDEALVAEPMHPDDADAKRRPIQTVGGVRMVLVHADGGDCLRDEGLPERLTKLLYETDGTADHILEVAALYGIDIRLSQPAAGIDVAVVEWRAAHMAYNAEVAKGPVIPPDEPNFAPWERMRAADDALWALAARLAPNQVYVHDNHTWDKSCYLCLFGAKQ